MESDDIEVVEEPRMEDSDAPQPTENSMLENEEIEKKKW